MRATYLIVVLLATFVHASGISGDMFIKGNACAMSGRDSLACMYYELAYVEDTSSIVLKEKYAKYLMKTKRSEEAAVIFRSVADYYIAKQAWSEALSACSYVYNVTCGYYDGNRAITMFFYEGFEDLDTLKISRANRAWNILIDKALSNNCIDSALYIMVCRVRAYLEAVLRAKSTGHCPVKVVGSSREMVFNK